MNDEMNEPRVAPPKVSYAKKEALRRAPEQTTYPARVWAAAAVVAMMVGAAGALWSPSQDAPTPKTQTTTAHQITVSVAEPVTTPTAQIDTAAIAVRVRPTARPMVEESPEQEDRVELIAQSRIEVARIEVDRMPFIALNAQDMKLQIHRQQEQPTESRPRRFNPLESFNEAFAIDWKAQAEHRAQVMTRQRNLLQEIPQKFSKIFASSKTSKKEKNNENN